MESRSFKHNLVIITVYVYVYVKLTVYEHTFRTLNCCHKRLEKENCVNAREGIKR